MNIDVIDRSLVDVDDMIRVLLAAPPERFDMKRWYTTTGCGTAACVGGWCAWDRRIASRYSRAEPRELVELMIPALSNASTYTSCCCDGSCGLLGKMAERWFIYGASPWERSSKVDDEPFTATPAETTALGADYARGLAEREAALNRLRIVRACLERWRAAIVAQQESAPVAERVEQAEPARVGVSS